MEHDDHEEILAEFLKQYDQIFRKSRQGMYVYLDDNNAACNEVLAKWLGYKGPKEWQAAGKGNFLKLVEPASQKPLVETYRAAMDEAAGGRVPVTWLARDGKKKVKTDVILVPIDSGGHRFALHFIEPV